MATTTEWASSPDHPGYRVKIINRGDFTIQIFRPELDADERTKRENHVKAVAERALRDYYIRKEKTS